MGGTSPQQPPIIRSQGFSGHNRAGSEARRWDTTITHPVAICEERKQPLTGSAEILRFLLGATFFLLPNRET